jgi:hypothetical protein
MNNTLRPTRLAGLATLCLAAATPALADLRAVVSGNGLQVESAPDAWPRLQGRIVGPLGTTPAAPGLRAEERGMGLNTGSALLGDLYLSSSFLGPNVLGGFRASSGLFVGQRGLGSVSAGAWGLASLAGSTGAAAGDGNTGSVPYLGLGYSGLSARGGWGFTADVGLVALNPGSAVRFGRNANPSQTLEDTLRDLRLSPLLRLGVSYEF